MRIRVYGLRFRCRVQTPLRGEYIGECYKGY